jgi:uncharacterized membrane protein (DUF2068 family)
MFDFNKVSNTLNKIESFLTEQKKQREAELLANVATNIYTSFNTHDFIEKKHLTVDAAIAVAQEIVIKTRVKVI